MSKKIEIDRDTADRITAITLRDYRAYLKKEIKQWKKNPKTDSNPNGYCCIRKMYQATYAESKRWI